MGPQKDLLVRKVIADYVFGLFGPEVVKFVDMREALITFVCALKRPEPPARFVSRWLAVKPRKWT